MKVLIVEDEMISRQIIVEYFSQYGECDTAVDGDEAVALFREALESGHKYDLISLDIMLPETDGQTVLKKIREIEAGHKIFGLKGVKVIMTTALNDFNNIKTAFNSQCEGYIVKPIDLDKLTAKIKELKLID